MPTATARAAALIGAALAAVGGHAQEIAPAAEHAPLPAAAERPEPDAPALAHIPDAKLAKLFHVDPAYPRAANAHVKVVGAFEVAPPPRTHLVAAWSGGYLPVTLSFSDGRCYVLTAIYFGGTLSNGRLAPRGCDGRPTAASPTALPPAGRSLRWISGAWGYGAWADDRAGATIVTAPYGKAFEPLFTARMPAIAMMAMNSPDSATGNVTLVGPIGDRLTVVTLEVSY